MLINDANQPTITKFYSNLNSFIKYVNKCQAIILSDNSCKNKLGYHSFTWLVEADFMSLASLNKGLITFACHCLLSIQILVHSPQIATILLFYLSYYLSAIKDYKEVGWFNYLLTSSFFCVLKELLCRQIILFFDSSISINYLQEPLILRPPMYLWFWGLQN